MTLKKLLLIGSISVVAITAAVVIPITVTQAIKNKSQSDSSKKQKTDADVIDDDDKLGPTIQSNLNAAYDLYFAAAEADDDIITQTKDRVYLSSKSGLSYSTDADKLYWFSTNSGVWNVYSSSKISLTSVIIPEQQFGGYYVYY